MISVYHRYLSDKVVSHSFIGIAGDGVAARQYRMHSLILHRLASIRSMVTLF